MKILHVISSGGLYGAETMTVGLCRSLKDAGHYGAITFFDNVHAPNGQLLEFACTNEVPIVALKCNGRLDFEAVRSLRLRVREEHFDLIHAHGYKADIYAYAANFGMRKPMISTCHTWYDNDPIVYLYGILDRRILRRFNMTVAVSNAVAEQLQKAGVAEDKIHIIDNGIDLKRFGDSDGSLRKELNHSGPLIGLVGRLAPEKGVQYFLQAAQRVLREFPAGLFVIVGDGPDRGALEATARELGIANHVRFLGSRRDMPQVYASLAVLVLSSVQEGLPMTLLEALAARRAVVATRVGAVPKVILHEQTGLLVQPADPQALADAIGQLLRDPSLCLRLGNAGRAHVQNYFSAEATAHAYLELYRSLVPDHGGMDD
jgi:glycosyltransferase involved in cell wall biosynthesis